MQGQNSSLQVCTSIVYIEGRHSAAIELAGAIAAPLLCNNRLKKFLQGFL